MCGIPKVDNESEWGLNHNPIRQSRYGCQVGTIRNDKHICQIYHIAQADIKYDF